MKTIMVFGATGLLGAYISLHFHGKGWKVIAVGRRKSDNGFFAGYGIPYYSVDIIMKDEFGKLPKDHIDVVAHFAGDLPASMEGYDGIRYIDSILKGTYNVLQFMHENGIPKIIFPQSLFDISYLFGSKTPIPADSVRKAPLEGDAVIDARQDYDQQGRPVVSMQMNGEGTKTWARLTKDNIGRCIAIVLDGMVASSPNVNDEIKGGSSQISGRFDVKEAGDLANILKSGKLPAPHVSSLTRWLEHHWDKRLFNPVCGHSSLRSCWYWPICYSFIVRMPVWLPISHCSPTCSSCSVFWHPLEPY